MVMTFLALLMTAPAAPTTEPATPEKPRLVCRKSQQETGSHIRTGRRCKTAEEWAREDEERGRMSPSAQITEGQPDARTKSPPPPH